MSRATSKGRAANQPFQLDRSLFRARCVGCWVLAGMVALVVASFWSLGLDFAGLFSSDALGSMGRFFAEFSQPDLKPAFLERVWQASLETLAMSLFGTLMAVVAGLMLAVPAARLSGVAGLAVQLLLNALRSIPELVWAALLLIAAGLGPFAGTLALALHTAGVLGRLFAEAIQNTDPGPARALQIQGCSRGQIFWFATLPQIMPQLIAYSLYRWENNIRAAAILGVVGAGGLGQMLTFHMGLFQMGKTATILLAMIALVLLVDGLSQRMRVWLK